MSQIKCPICRKIPIEPINLRCEHHPCFTCIQPHLSHQGTKSTLEQKFKIVCPACHKKTVLYDLRHLIVTSNEEGCFVSNSFVEQKLEVKVKAGMIRYDSSHFGSEQSGQHTRRGSIQSIANGKLIFEVKCSEHGEPYKYFCCDCSQRGLSCLLCSQCAKPHYSSGHKLLSLRQAEPRLQSMNQRSKEDLSARQGELSYLVGYVNHNKAIIDEYFGKLEDNLTAQFKTLYSVLQNKYSTLKAGIRSKHEEQTKALSEKMDKIVSNQGIVQSLMDIDLKDLEMNAKFYQTYEKVNFSAMKGVQGEIDFNQLPHIFKEKDYSGKLADDWIYMKEGVKEQELSMPKKSSRRSSNAQEQYSHRSVRDKENAKVGLSPRHVKPNPRKLLC